MYGLVSKWEWSFLGYNEWTRNNRKYSDGIESYFMGLVGKNAFLNKIFFEQYHTKMATGSGRKCQKS